MAAHRLKYHSYEDLLKRLKNGGGTIQAQPRKWSILGEGKHGGIAKKAFLMLKDAGYLKKVADNHYIFQEIQMSIFDIEKG